MPLFTPSFRIEEEYPSQLHLASADRRWVILTLTLLLIAPLICLGVLAFLDEEIRFFGFASIGIGLSFLALILFVTPFKSKLTINSGMRTVIFSRSYMLGENIREKEWIFNEITDVNLVKNNFSNLIEIDINGKKAQRLNFGSKANEAQHVYNVVQSWIKGLIPESTEAETALQELASEKQTQSALKNAEKLLNYFGIFSLIGGAMGLFTDNALEATISIPTVIDIGTGLTYLACAYGAKRKFEPALWVAILVVLAERLYWFIMSGTLSGEGNWSSWLTWIFAFIVVSSLWQAIRSIRTMDKEAVYEPLV